MKTHRRLICLLLAAATVPLGLAWRFAPLGLSPFFYKYGGSVLWAVMLYWLVAAATPRSNPARIAVTSCAIAALVELSRLIHTPASDAFRLTLAGKLLLGRFFSGYDILTYWLAISATSLTDSRLLKQSPDRQLDAP